MADKKGKHGLRRVISTVFSGDGESSAINRISRKLKQHIQNFSHEDESCTESNTGPTLPGPPSTASTARFPPSLSHLDGFLVKPPPRSYAVYPPRVTFQVLGYISDASGIGYSRDIGRSSVLGSRVLFQFGDTFCKNNAGEFLGIVSHTCAALPDPREPTVTQYLDFQHDGKVEQFVPFSGREARFELDGARHGGRVTLWSFGGIAEESPGVGWCWFESGEIFNDGHSVTHGTGVVRVELETCTNKVIVTRPMDLIFGPDEPRWGTFSTLAEGNYVYLWGHHKNGVMLARVRADCAADKSAYEYWDGMQYVLCMAQAQPVLVDFQQGAIYPTKLFRPHQGLDYVFLGVRSTGDSCVQLSVAQHLEGPWLDWHELFVAPGINVKDGYKYCMYPHPWAFQEKDGELMVTWCEHWPGGVVAAKVKFEMGG